MHNRLTELMPENHGLSTDIVIEPSLAGAGIKLLERIGFSSKRLLIVCDAPTHAALGTRLMREISKCNATLLRFEGRLHADEEALKLIQVQPADAFIAVGSGVISDLCKYASHLQKKPYAVFPTAPSMNGYLSSSASMTLNGIKESHPSHLPVGVFCDLNVIAAAPVRLIRSGLGDSLCRSTAQADWLLSHLLLDTPYSALPFDLLKPYESELFAQSGKLVTGDLKAIELLMRTLLVSGIGMTLSGGSYPASQGEHMIAHTMEMKHEDALPETFHGEQIGVTTLTMAKLQHELLSHPLILPPELNWQEALALYFRREKAQYLSPGPEKKYRLYEQLALIEQKLQKHGQEICGHLSEVMLTEAQLRDVLLRAGAPVTPAELGWQETNYQEAVRRARYTRDRFTFLDLQSA